MPIRQITQAELDELFGAGVILMGQQKPEIKPKRKKISREIRSKHLQPTAMQQQPRNSEQNS
jgi:hypothetical protein